MREVLNNQEIQKRVLEESQREFQLAVGLQHPNIVAYKHFVQQVEGAYV